MTLAGVGIDLTITLGSLIEIGVLAAGGIAALTVLRQTVQQLNDGLTTLKEETKEQFAGIQSEVKKIADVLIIQADMNRRIFHLEEDFRELRTALPRAGTHRDN